MRNSGIILFTCSGLLLCGGTILGGATAWSLIRFSYFFWTSDLGVELGSCTLVVAGALLCLPACWMSTIVPYHPRSWSLHGTLIGVVLAAMLMLSSGLSSVSSLSRALRSPGAINASMMRAMARDSYDHNVRSSFAAMQLELQCCGVQSHRDWYQLVQHRQLLPLSCCGISNPKTGRVAHGALSKSILLDPKCDKPLYLRGCLEVSLKELRNFCNSVSVLGYTIILVLCVTLLASSYILVVSVVEPRPQKLLQPLRVAYLPAGTQLATVASPLGLPNTLPIALPPPIQ